LQRVFEAVPTLRRIWADQGYQGPLVKWVKDTFSCELDIVRRKGKKFEALPRRWVMERTFAWLGRYRRLAREYEKNRFQRGNDLCRFYPNHVKKDVEKVVSSNQ
jgi:putative transposase